MATVEASRPSAAQLATWRVMDDEMDTVIAGREGRFPSRMAFVPSDLATDEVIREHHGGGYAVVIVDEHGNERFLPVP